MPRRTAYDDPRRRNRPREEGPVRIFIRWHQVLIALISLTIGGVIRGILGQHSNDGYLDEQGCPVLDGQVSNWLTNIGNLIIAFGVLYLAVSGIISKFLLGCGFRDGAICCGQLFMSLLGKLVVGVATVTILLFNLYGTSILTESNKDMQWETKGTETYCDKTVVTLFKTINFGVYAIIGIIFFITSFLCIKKCCVTDSGDYQKKKTDNLDLDEEERQFLKECGCKFVGDKIYWPPKDPEDDLKSKKDLEKKDCLKHDSNWETDSSHSE